MSKKANKINSIVKGKFPTPWSTLGVPFQERSWVNNVMPEYLWLGLIVNYYDRKKGLEIAAKILKYLACNIKLNSAKMSEIFNLSQEKQAEFYNFCLKIMPVDVLCPLTILFSLYKQPTFAKMFTNIEISVENRAEKLIEILTSLNFHQNELATDVRYLEILYMTFLNKMHFAVPGVIEALENYPITEHSDMKMRGYRPSVRSTEMALSAIYDDNEEYINFFWAEVSKMTSCKIMYKQIEEKHDEIDITKFMAECTNKMIYYSNQVSKDPFNYKLLVLCGIANYSYKRMSELIEHTLYNAASGRSIIRVLVENYIMMKYLVKHESEHTDIWQEFQYYGIGQYKLIVQRFQASGKSLPNSHIDFDYIDSIVNEFKNDAFIGMDTRYFGNIGIRDKAIDVDEKDLYDYYYDYDSQFEHGLWGAIREFALLKCTEVGHQYHDVLDVQQIQKLPSIWDDSKIVIKKTFDLLKDTFGLPDGVIGGNNE